MTEEVIDFRGVVKKVLDGEVRMFQVKFIPTFPDFFEMDI
jgi:hypothetical protein